MKKIFLILLTGIVVSGCYTTFYPTAGMEMTDTDAIPDSTREIIINNYYETTEYYQIPHYRRYSLLWGGYYWDPFYYDYDYYYWRPYYWYGSYYYYNPRSHYWYYYDHHYPWHYGNWNGGSSNNGNQDRIHKPGYSVLMSSPTGAAPFVSVGTDNGTSGSIKPVGKIGVNVNSGLTDQDGYSNSTKIKSVGKQTIGNNSSSGTSTVKKQKPTSSSGSSTPSSSSGSTYKKNPSNSSSSSSGKSKAPSTSGTSSKNSNHESSSSSSKKSK